MTTPKPVTTIFVAAFTFGGATLLHGQGCVAARGSGMANIHDEAMTERRWELSVSHRFFESDRHFVGGHEETQRRNEGSEVINRSHFLELGLSRRLSDQWTVGAVLPYVSHDRSQTLRNAARQVIRRFHTQSAGPGDLRVEASYLLRPPSSQPKGNVQLGVGLALPTGSKGVTDTFQTYNTTTGVFGAEERTVDQSIQPGTGGYAVIFSGGARYELLSGLNAYGDASYALTPQETNGVPTYRSNPYEATMSITDTYLVRAGLEWAALPQWGITLSLGLRAEGVPIRDLVGGSNGFRRPGYSVALELGITIDRGNWSARLYVPTAINRNRLRSVADEQWTAASGVHRHGDAAFADYLIASSVAVRF